MANYAFTTDDEQEVALTLLQTQLGVETNAEVFQRFVANALEELVYRDKAAESQTLSLSQLNQIKNDALEQAANTEPGQ